MEKSDHTAGSNRTGTGRFHTTHWSVVIAAARPASPKYRQALGKLCKTYWFPLYAYLRRHGYSSHQAEDYTQAFFARLLEKKGLRLADPRHGKFRSFLLASLKHFVSNELDRARAKKRGGGRKILSLTFENAESRYTLEPPDRLSPEKLFERSWALTVLEKAMTQMKAEATTAGKLKVFEHLKPYLTAKKASVPYRRTAARLKMTEAAVKVAVHRLRKRYRKLLRDEIAQTVATEDQIDEEIRDLFAALTG
jgi:RNA polymerase sigma-70 factor (ECF subfamily)